MTPKELKNSILQLAIEGKLVKQRKEDGSAETLYAEIKNEKQKLIKQGKIKKEKPLPEITDDEIPFEIPKSWKWVRLGEIGIFVRGHGIKRDEIVEKGYPCIRYGQLYTTYKMRCKNIVSHIKADLFNKMIKAKKHDILMSLTGENEYDIALALAYDGEDDVAIGGDMVKFTNINNYYMYLVYVINSSYGIKCKSELATGKIIVHISSDKLASIKVPLPPLAEQKRIVEKIEELMPLVDRYEVLYNRLKELNKEFPKKLKNAVLQKAIEGKLVPQIKSEGSAEDLYKEIQKEKQKLIKEGKIKKEKELPEITEDEVPFEIPKSWKLTRLGDISKFSGGYSFKSTNYTKNGVRVIRISDFNNDRILDDEIVKYKYDAKLEEYIVNKDDILMCMTGGTVGKSCIINKVNEKMVINQRVAKITAIKCCSKYIYYIIKSPFIQDIIHSNKTSTNDNISKELIDNFAIPFPPLTEQKRIVEKIEEILSKIEKLEKYN